MKLKFLSAVLASGLFFVAAHAQGQEERFDISRFDIQGNTILKQTEIDALVAPFVGQKRNYGDIQKALEAVENAYRGKGFGTVNVYVPEQELTAGTVRIQVTESVIGKINVTGNKFFDTANVRASLPLLVEGVTPNLRTLSESVQLVNENPAKQVDVTLGVSADPDKVDATVKVEDNNPSKFILSLDNTGSDTSGKIRTGLAYQHANLFGRDQVLTMAYTTSPDKPKGTEVDVYSVAYRHPLYSWGDSIDVIYGNSNVTTPTPQATGFGAAFGIAGKGEVISIRWNHLFPRRGEYTSRMVVGLDHKYFNTRCPITGVATSYNPPNAPGAVPSCIPHSDKPISVSYMGQRQGVGFAADFNLGVAMNLPLGTQYTDLTGVSRDRYSYIANRLVPDDFVVYRYGGSYAKAFGDWQVRGALTGQYTPGGLISGEQLSLAGSTAVRGFRERAVAVDRGHVVILETYSPDFGPSIGIPGNLRAVAFFDFARGNNLGLPALSTAPNTEGISSGGLGLRYSKDKDLSLKLDFAVVAQPGPVGTESRGDVRGHLNLSFGF
jgi:hemolysin activation/secretion protein